MRRNGWQFLVVFAVIGLFVAPVAAQDIYGTTVSMAPNVDKRISQLEAELAELRQAVDADTEGLMQCDRLYSGMIVEIEYLRLWARRTGMVADIDTTGGVIRNVDYNFDDNNGVRVAFGYRFESCWDVIFTYTHFDTDGGVAATIEGGTIDVAARATLNYDVLDLEAGRWRCINPNTDLRMFAGIRYGIIDQTSIVNVATVAPGQTRDVTATSNVDAFGLRAGGQLNWKVGRNISLFGRGAGGILVADSANRFVLVGTPAIAGDGDYRDTPYQAMPTLEAAIGASWRHEGIELAVGYEMTQWFNMATNLPDVNAISGTLVNQPGDLLVDGFFLKAAWNY